MDYNADLMLFKITEADIAEMAFKGKDIQELITALKSKEANEEIFMKDMAFITMVVALRGTSKDKIVARSSDEGKRRFQILINKYGVVPHNKSAEMKTPTLPRIAGLFPMLTYKLRLTFPGRFPVIGERTHVGEAFMFPGACAIIKDESLDEWLTWYQTFCDTVKIDYNEENALLANKFSRIHPDHRLRASLI
jgi:hypothetical protein